MTKLTSRQRVFVEGLLGYKLFGKFVVLALVAVFAGYYDIFWTIRTAATYRYFVVNIVFLACWFMAPIAIAILYVYLFQNIINSEVPRRVSYPDAATAGMKTVQYLAPIRFVEFQNAFTPFYSVFLVVTPTLCAALVPVESVPFIVSFFLFIFVANIFVVAALFAVVLQTVRCGFEFAKAAGREISFTGTTDFIQCWNCNIYA